MSVKRKVNNRGNGSCQVVIPKIVMDHLKINAGDEIDFKLVANQEYVLLKKSKELKPVKISNDKIIEQVQDFINYIDENKKDFRRFGMQSKWHALIGKSLMLLNENATIKIMQFLIDDIEVTISSMYCYSIENEESIAGKKFVDALYDEYWKIQKSLEVFKELREPKEFESIINDLALIIESYYSKSYKIAAIESIVFENLKEPSVDFETKVELLNVCIILLDESGETGEDIELIREFIEKALNSVVIEN